MSEPNKHTSVYNEPDKIKPVYHIFIRCYIFNDIFQLYYKTSAISFSFMLIAFAQTAQNERKNGADELLAQQFIFSMHFFVLSGQFVHFI